MSEDEAYITVEINLDYFIKLVPPDDALEEPWKKGLSFLRDLNEAHFYRVDKAYNTLKMTECYEKIFSDSHRDYGLQLSMELERFSKTTENFPTENNYSISVIRSASSNQPEEANDLEGVRKKYQIEFFCKLRKDQEFFKAKSGLFPNIYFNEEKKEVKPSNFANKNDYFSWVGECLIFLNNKAYRIYEQHSGDREKLQNHLSCLNASGDGSKEKKKKNFKASRSFKVRGSDVYCDWHAKYKAGKLGRIYFCFSSVTDVQNEIRVGFIAKHL